MPYSLGTVRDLPVRGLKLSGLTWAGEFLWFSEAVLNQVIAVEPASGRIQGRLSCPRVRGDLTALSGNLMQVTGEECTLRILDSATGELVGELPNPRAGHRLSGIEASRHGIWLGYPDLHRLELRATTDLDLLDVIPVPGDIAGVTASDHYVAYSDYKGGTINLGTINLIDLHERREVASCRVPGNPTGITWDGDRIWYCDFTTFQLRAIELPGITSS